MPTMKSVVVRVRPARAYPTPKRAPARMNTQTARANAHNVRKPKSR